MYGARVSVRLSPRNPFNGMSDSQPEKTYLHVAEQLENESWVSYISWKTLLVYPQT